MLRMRLCPVPATRRRSRGEPRRRRRSRRRPKRRAGKRLGHPSRPPLVLFNLGGHRQARKPTPQPWAGVAPGTRGAALRTPGHAAACPRSSHGRRGPAPLRRSARLPHIPPRPKDRKIFFFFFFPAETNRQASSPSLLPPTLFSTLTLLHYTNFIVKLSRVFTGDPRHPPPQLSRGIFLGRCPSHVIPAPHRGSARPIDESFRVSIIYRRSSFRRSRDESDERGRAPGGPGGGRLVRGMYCRTRRGRPGGPSAPAARRSGCARVSAPGARAGVSGAAARAGTSPPPSALLPPTRRFGPGSERSPGGGLGGARGAFLGEARLLAPPV